MRHLTTALMLTLSVGTLVCEAQQPDLELKRSVVTAEAERAKGSELRPNLEVITLLPQDAILIDTLKAPQQRLSGLMMATKLACRSVPTLP